MLGIANNLQLWLQKATPCRRNLNGDEAQGRRSAPGKGPLGEQFRLGLVELLGRQGTLFLQLVELVQFVSGGAVGLFADV
jgi:hypothetical protein